MVENNKEDKQRNFGQNILKNLKERWALFRKGQKVKEDIKNDF